MDSTKCTVATMSNDLLEGTSYDETKFIGLTPAIKEIDKLQENVLNAPNIIGNNFDNTDWINTEEDALY